VEETPGSTPPWLASYRQGRRPEVRDEFERRFGRSAADPERTKLLETLKEIAVRLETLRPVQLETSADQAFHELRHSCFDYGGAKRIQRSIAGALDRFIDQGTKLHEIDHRPGEALPDGTAVPKRLSTDVAFNGVPLSFPQALLCNGNRPYAGHQAFHRYMLEEIAHTELASAEKGMGRKQNIVETESANAGTPQNTHGDRFARYAGILDRHEQGAKIGEMTARAPSCEHNGIFGNGCAGDKGFFAGKPDY
jgi:hypothetical protein